MRTTIMSTTTKHDTVTPKASFGLDGQIRPNCQARKYHIPSIPSNVARNKYKGPASTSLSHLFKDPSTARPTAQWHLKVVSACIMNVPRNERTHLAPEMDKRHE